MGLNHGTNTIFDIDFTKGPVDEQNLPVGLTLETHGGRWESGWRVVNHGDRIIIDPGQTIPSGYLEATVTMAGAPWEIGGKIAWLGIWEPTLSSQRSPGDFYFVRHGKTKYGMSMSKMVTWDQGKKFHSAIENVNTDQELLDWATDDSRAMVIRLDWKDGFGTTYLPNGKQHACPRGLQPRQ